MVITDSMLFAAIKQAVADKILPKYADEETYLHHYAAMRRILEAAFNTN